MKDRNPKSLSYFFFFFFVVVVVVVVVVDDDDGFVDFFKRHLIFVTFFAITYPNRPCYITNT